MSDTIYRITEKISSIVWGAPTIIALIGTGIFFTVLLSFFQFTNFRLWLDNTLFAVFKKKEVRTGSKNSISQFQAVSTALAATIGTGNIAGVATAICTGGPGAVFWMWVSALFGMMTSYAENTLGIYYRMKDNNGQWCGGPMYYIESGLKEKKQLSRFAKPLAVFYAVFLIGASYGIGNMTQANSISASLGGVFGLSDYVCGALTAAFTLAVIAGGVKRIGSVTEKLVPFMALFYVGSTLFIFLTNFKSIPYVFSSIFANAFSCKAVFGAAGGLAVSKCITTGFRRGVFSNEAGLGASVTVNACSNITEPAKQGMWGIFQVFADTMIVCTMTAFVLLSTGVDAVPIEEAFNRIGSETQYVYIGQNQTQDGPVMLADKTPNPILKMEAIGKDCTDGKSRFFVETTQEYTYANVMALKGVFNSSGELTDVKLEAVDGVSLVTLAFQSRFGSLSAVMLSAAIVLFAFSTVIGWSFYGVKAAEYLFGNKSTKIYKAFYVLFSFIGSVTQISLVWGISDIFNALMAVPNLIALLSLSGTVKKITHNYLNRQNGEKTEPMLSYDAEIQFEQEALSST